MKGIVILFCIAGLLLAVTPVNAAGDQKKTDRTPGLQQSSEQPGNNGKTIAPVEAKPVEVKKEVTTQPSYSTKKEASPSPEPSPVTRDYTAPVVQSYFNYNSSNRGGGGGGGNEGGHGRGGGGNGNGNGNERGGGGYHGHSGYYDNPWRYRGFRSDWNFWAGPGPVFVPYYSYDYTVPYSMYTARLDRGVYVQSAANDAVGSNLAASLGDHARADNLVLVSSPDQASLELFITSSDEDPVQPNTLSAVSVTFIWLPGYRFITSQVMNVGSERVEDAAGAVADYAAQLIKTYRH